ncbi:DUF1684 domain-containing protein [Aquimarina sp. W85]|uniref:DUF1684 domain-containing protein n=1 Tax=Aquimarina rhodophyticola TaxID=3342246 RepID=UPI00366B3EDF
MNKIVLISMLFIGIIGSAQDSIAIKRIISFQNDLNKKFISEDTSPLPEKELSSFEALEFFEINTAFSIKAKFVRTPFESPFMMKTSTESESIYVKYGEVHFKINKIPYRLNIYQNQELKTQAEYEEYLFLPFTDLSNGISSYIGGRYIDLTIPEGDTILIDFNTAYNPYCAYNQRYSCPMPPKENHLDLEVLAGVKKNDKYIVNN